MASEHWSQIREVENAGWKFRFMLWAALHLPGAVVEGIVAVVCFFFCLGAKPVRERSRIYMEHVARKRQKKVPLFAEYRHILAFALSMIEKLRGWAGKMSFADVECFDDDIGDLVRSLNDGRGAFVLCSHLGNIEALRSLTGYDKEHTVRKFKVFPVVDFSGTGRFNALLRELNPELMRNGIDANSIGVESAVWMRDRIAEGNLVAIAGDRTSAHSRGRTVSVNFLGEPAEFPEGAFTLAMALKCPVYFIFAFRKRDLDPASPYEFHVIRAKTKMSESRGKRKERLVALVSEYGKWLESYCLEHPYQWYNFYNFWQRNSL